jgi:DNA end-binding protein Ku
LRETGRCAIGRWAPRGNANIVMLRPMGNVLIMQQLRFAPDVKPASEIEIPQQDVKPAERAHAKQRIEQPAKAARKSSRR